MSFRTLRHSSTNGLLDRWRKGYTNLPFLLCSSHGWSFSNLSSYFALEPTRNLSLPFPLRHLSPRRSQCLHLGRLSSPVAVSSAQVAAQNSVERCRAEAQAWAGKEKVVPVARLAASMQKRPVQKGQAVAMRWQIGTARTCRDRLTLEMADLKQPSVNE